MTNWRDYIKVAGNNTVYRVQSDVMPKSLLLPPWQQGHPGYDPSARDPNGYQWDRSGRVIPQLRAVDPILAKRRDAYRKALQEFAKQPNPSSDPDEMLGRRMNPLLIAPGFAVAGGLPTSAVGAVGLGATGIGIEEVLKHVDPRLQATAHVAMAATPLVAKPFLKTPKVVESFKGYDASRAAIAGYLANKKGLSYVDRKQLIGNLSKTDPGLVDSDVIISMPRWKLRRALTLQPNESLGSKTVRGLTDEALQQALGRGYETWPSTSMVNGKRPFWAGYDRNANGRPYVGVTYSDKITTPSISAPVDSFSPTSRTVLEELASGKTPQQIVKQWHDRSPDLRHYYNLDAKSPLGVKVKDEYKILLKNLDNESINGRYSAHVGYGEKKYIGDVPYSQSNISGVLIPEYASRGKGYENLAATLNAKGIPFAKGVNRDGGIDMLFDLPKFRDYEGVPYNSPHHGIEYIRNPAIRRALLIGTGKLMDEKLVR